MRKSGILVVITCIVLSVLAPCAAAGAMTYSTRVIQTSASSKGFVRANGPWAVWNEADVEWLNESDYALGPYMVLLYDTRTQKVVNIDPGPDEHVAYDVGPGFVVYTSAPAILGPMSVELYDISRGTRLVLATGIDSVKSPSAPVCGDSFVAWADNLLHIYDVQTSAETTYAISSWYHSLAADGESLAWIEPSGETGDLASVHWLNARTGAHRKTSIPSFSPIMCSLSAAGVLVEGEGSSYRSALYMWNPATGNSRKLVGVEDSYHYVSASRGSASFVAWSHKSSKEYPNSRTAVMDLSTGNWELAYPYLNAATVGEIDGNRLWFTQVNPARPLSDTLNSIGYVDIGPEPKAPVDDDVVGVATRSFASGESEVESETVESSSAVVATVEPTESAPLAVAQAPGSPKVAPEPSASGLLSWLTFAAVGGLALTGGAAFARRRNAKGGKPNSDAASGTSGEVPPGS